MDDKFKKLGFKDFITVDYTGTGDEFLAYQAQKRRRGHYDTWGDDYTPEEGEQLDEVSRQTRMKRKLSARKNKRKMAMGRERAKRRAPTREVIQKRARKQARKAWMQKRAKGQPLHSLSMGRKQELEKMADKPASQARIQRNAKKLEPQIRKADRERRSGAGQKRDR
jgi:hypothetical protein